jgi:hypothetical protein
VAIAYGIEHDFAPSVLSKTKKLAPKALLAKPYYDITPMIQAPTLIQFHTGFGSKN